MTEDEARAWVEMRFGARATESVAQFAAIVTDEATRQNLVAASTLPSIWTRHIVDSAQLVTLGNTAPAGTWLDIGSGAGFPGLVVALLSERPVALVEPRTRRAAFLSTAAEHLGLASRVTTYQQRVETLTLQAAIISARAVAPLYELFDWAGQCACGSTRWILPKGRSALEEVESVQQTWHGMFHVEQSVTDPASLIVVASGVARR